MSLEVSGTDFEKKKIQILQFFENTSLKLTKGQ